MGLAGKLGTTAPSAPSAPPAAAQPGGGGAYGAPPAQAQPGQSPYGQPGGQTPGQFGQPGQQQFGQQPGQQGQQGNPFNPQGNPFGQPGGQPGQPQGQFGQQPGQFGQQQGQFGQQGQHGQQQPGQFGQQGQFGGQPGQFGQQGSQGQFGQQGNQGQFGQQQGQYGQQPGGRQQGQQFGQPGQNNQQPGQFGQQQGQFGAPPSQHQQQFQGSIPGGPPAAGAFDHQTIRQKLMQLINENRLQAFYPPQRADQLVQFVASRDVAGLGARWRIPREVTLDLIGLALYDIVIYVDDSGSMAFEEGGERIDDMKAVLGRTADAATLFDTDGIVVRFMNGTTEGNGIHSEAEATALVQNIKFSGTTPLGTNLDRKVLQPMVLSQARSNSMQKPVLVICITDGEPTGEPKDTVRQVVMNAKQQLQNSPYGSGAVAFQFAQVGKDAAATRFLSALDTDPVIGSMIDCTSYYEQEQEEYARKGINLDPSLYLVKLMVGGIDRSYDEGDEG